MRFLRLTNPNFIQSDGTLGGTFFVGNAPGGIASPTPIGTNLFFSVSNDVWLVNSNAGSLSVAADFGSLNPPMVSPEYVTAFQGAVVFTEGGEPFGRELWTVAPGQTATLVEDLNPGGADANVVSVVAASDKIFYLARPSGQAAWQLRVLHLQSLNPPAKAPWTGTPLQLPGQIEAENFDVGGEGQGYHDTTIVNEGGVYRKTEAVDITAGTDTNGGYAVFDTAPGEWLEYTVSAPATGLYEVDTRAASGGDGAQFDLSVDGVPTGVTNTAPNTGGINNWTTAPQPNVQLTAGVHVLRLTFDTAGTAGDAGAYNFLNVLLTAVETPPVVAITQPAIGSIYGPGDLVPLQAVVSSYVGAPRRRWSFSWTGKASGWTPPVLIRTPGGRAGRACPDGDRDGFVRGCDHQPRGVDFGGYADGGHQCRLAVPRHGRESGQHVEPAWF